MLSQRWFDNVLRVVEHLIMALGYMSEHFILMKLIEPRNAAIAPFIIIVTSYNHGDSKNAMVV